MASDSDSLLLYCVVMRASVLLCAGALAPHHRARRRLEVLRLESLQPAPLRRWFHLLNQPRMSSKNRAFVSEAGADGGGVVTHQWLENKWSRQVSHPHPYPYPLPPHGH